MTLCIFTFQFYKERNCLLEVTTSRMACARTMETSRNVTLTYPQDVYYVFKLVRDHVLLAIEFDCKYIYAAVSF